MLILATSAFAEPLSLAEAVRRAVARHPNVESAKASLRAAAEKSNEVRAAYKPRVDYQENWVRSNNPVFVFGSLLTQRQFGPANFAIDALNRPGALNNLQSLVMAEQMLWDGGRTRKSLELAEVGRKAAQLGVQQMELAMASRTARAYLDAQLTRAAIPVAEQAVKSAEADLARAMAAEEAGRATAADALSVKVHLAAMQEQLVMRRAEAKAAETMLRELVGAAPGEIIELNTPLEAAQLAADTAPALRPEVEQKRLEVDLARKQGELARLAWMPQVGVRVGFEADRQRFVTRGGSNWMAGVSLKWTPYQGGAERARARMAAESQRAAEAGVAALQRQVAVEVEQAATMLEASQARLTTAAAAIAAAEESLRITRDRYEAGLATVTELLRADTALVESRLRLLAAQHGVRCAQLNQAAALGRLNPEAEVLR
jgi:outer membrane protein TolC